jgi:protein-disulfide isomerase
MTVFRRHAQELQLDQQAWGACMSEHVMVPMIRADYDRGVQANVRSTPSFFIGDTVIEGAQGIAEFRTAIDRALQQPAAQR